MLWFFVLTLRRILGKVKEKDAEGISVSRKIISCKTIEPELNSAMKQVGCCDEVLWLESGLHNVPKKLNARLQELLDQCGDADTVLLAMSFCGNSVVGLKTGDFQLVMPRSDDCITLLLGSFRERLNHKATYFLTEGWLKGERNLWREYEDCLRRYGEKRGKWIFATMLEHYRNLALVDTGCADREKLEAEVREIARKLELEYVWLPGTLDFVKQLLTGPWPEERFVVIPSYGEVTAEDCRV